MSTHLLPNRFEYSAIKPYMNNCEADSMYETFLLWLRNPVKLSSNNNFLLKQTPEQVTRFRKTKSCSSCHPQFSQCLPNGGSLFQHHYE